MQPQQQTPAAPRFITIRLPEPTLGPAPVAGRSGEIAPKFATAFPSGTAELTSNVSIDPVAEDAILALPSQAEARFAQTAQAPVPAAAPVGLAVSSPASLPVGLAAPAVAVTPAAASLPAESAAPVQTASVQTPPRLASLPAVPVAATGLKPLQVQASPPADQQRPKVIDASQFSDFNLRRVSGSVVRNLRKTQTGAAPNRIQDRLIDQHVFHQSKLMIDGDPAGEIAIRIGPDLKPSVRVGDLLKLVGDRFGSEDLARFESVASANEHVSFATLRASGFDVTYNAGADRIGISVAATSAAP